MFDRSIYTRISEDIASGRRAPLTQLGADKADEAYFSEKELYAQDGADEGSPLELARRAMQSGELELAKSRTVFSSPSLTCRRRA